MNKILQISKPIIRGYSYYAHIFSMIQRFSKSEDWIFSNFIQLHYNAIINEKNIVYWSDFYYPAPHLSMYDICKWLFVRRENKDKILQSKTILLNFIKENLGKDYFIRIDIDHKYIKSFETNNHPHDSLIYGIDEEAKKIYVLDVFKNGIYENKEIFFDEFCEAAINCKVLTENFMHDCYETYEIIPNNDFKFSLVNVNNQILDYYKSTVPEYWRYICAEKADSKVFGIKSYDMLINLTDNLITQTAEIDIRPFYICKDHKTMMYKRFEYFKEQNYTDYPKIDLLISNYKQLETLSDTNIFLLLKYSKRPKNETLILIKENFKKMKEIEQKTLQDYLNYYNFILRP